MKHVCCLLKWWKWKIYRTQYSQAVTHQSTNPAQHCLTLMIRQEPKFSTWYGHRHKQERSTSKWKPSICLWQQDMFYIFKQSGCLHSTGISDFYKISKGRSIALTQCLPWAHTDRWADRQWKKGFQSIHLVALQTFDLEVSVFPHQLKLRGFREMVMVPPTHRKYRE